MQHVLMEKLFPFVFFTAAYLTHQAACIGIISLVIRQSAMLIPMLEFNSVILSNHLSIAGKCQRLLLFSLGHSCFGQ